MKTKLFFLISFSFIVLCLLGVFSPSNAYAQNCAIDLHNQEQVVERLALLKIKIEEISANNSEGEFYVLYYKEKLKLFSVSFETEELVLEQMVAKKYQELSKDKKKVNNEDKKIILNQVAEQAAKDLKRKEELMQILCERGFKGIEEATWSGRIPICYYSQRAGNEKVVNELIYFGANVNTHDSDQKTALMFAAEGHEDEIATLLLAHQADPNIQDKDGRTALMLSAARGYIKISNLLIDHGADVNLQDKLGNTALIYAVVNNKFKDVELLLANKADPNIATKTGDTPLKLAKVREMAYVVHLLKQHGAKK